MPQVQLPIFPDGFTYLSDEIGFQRKDGKVCYFNGHLPVFIHEEKDLMAFRIYTAQLVINGTVKQAQIIKAFGLAPVTVKRYVKQYREHGMRSFFKPPERRAGTSLSPEVLPQVQALLDQGYEIAQIEAQLGVLPSTLHKAIRSGRLRKSVAAKKKKIGRRAKRRPRVSVV
jgi:transposase-like protein